MDNCIEPTLLLNLAMMFSAGFVLFLIIGFICLIIEAFQYSKGEGFILLCVGLFLVCLIYISSATRPIDSNKIDFCQEEQLDANR